MANRTHRDIQVADKSDVKAVLAYFDGNTSSSPTSFDTKEIASVTRSAVGTFAVVFNHAYPTKDRPIVEVHGASPGIHARVSAWDPAAKTMTVVTSKVPGVPAWTTGVTVTEHVATLATAGYVVAVQATAGSSAGPKQMIQGGAAAAGQVRVEYSAAGVATLTFNTDDAVTACAVVIAPAGPVDLATTDRVHLTLLVRNTGVNT